METLLRTKDIGLTIGRLPTGPRNLISDVPGVTVGHATVDTPQSKTGVTVVMPSKENPFTHKLPAAAFVWNGFGKTAGLVQVEELGRLETPIALTNTLNVGKVHDAMVEYMLGRCQAEGVRLTSVNPVICECNDSTLNDISLRVVGREEVFSAIESASPDFAEGDVGGGKGMICHGLKGGIGSSSRQVEFDGVPYTVGVLVQTNHGCLEDLTVNGQLIGPQLAQTVAAGKPDKGSCIAILATDLPLDSRQLGRVARRMSVGLARLGSYVGHGSGEVFLAFSTANLEDAENKAATYPVTAFREDEIDPVFRAAAEACEEAVLHSMLLADTVTGWQGNTIYSLREFWKR